MLECVSKEFIIEFVQNNELDLQPTQQKLCLPIINRLFKKMKAGIKFPGIQVENGYICDGHHRYIAAALTNFLLDRTPGAISKSTIKGNWKSVIWEDNEWDSQAWINHMNEQDALFNNISIDQIVELLK